MNNRSRLSRRLERKTKQRLFVLFAGTILLIVFIFKFGIPFLIEISTFFIGSKGNQDSKKEQQSPLIPPLFNPLSNATNSATIVISGISKENQTVVLYLNNEVIGETKVEKNNTFEFKQIELKEGQNSIKAKNLKDNKTSDFSQEMTVVFDKEKPALEIESPQDGQSFPKDSKTITIKGKTEPGSRITVNGFWAIVASSGTFSHTISLQDGENAIKILSIDEAGNASEALYKVTYNP